MSRLPIALTVNGRPRRAEVEPRRNLADLLRETFGLVGTRTGCEHGICGACTVIVDGAAVRSCLMLAVQAEGAAVETVEGLGTLTALDALQASFRRHHAVQCGFCISGILMSLTALFRAMPSPDEAAIKEVLGGHICRCTGYQAMVAAALAVARGEA
jgi:aerobic-type carbon monoxide dehydrogenase small subunit (CoxS/CutS family)